MGRRFPNQNQPSLFDVISKRHSKHASVRVDNSQQSSINKFVEQLNLNMEIDLKARIDQKTITPDSPYVRDGTPTRSKSKRF